MTARLRPEMAELPAYVPGKTVPGAIKLASNETVFVEPQAIAEHSAQLSFLRAREAKEIRRILRWLSAQVGQVADSLLVLVRLTITEYVL